MILSHTVYGNLPRKSNHRRVVVNSLTGKRMLIKSKEALRYEQDFLKQIPEKLRKNISEPVELVATIYYPSRRPDLSDELFCDCLELAGVIKNDRQIVSKKLEKRIDRDNPRVVFALKIVEPGSLPLVIT